MGRRMFSGGAGAWSDDPNANGWWGDTPPYDVPVFVLTHHAREPLVMQGQTAFTFVTDSIEAALEQARAAAGDRDVLVAGGAQLAQQYLEAGLLDVLQIHVAPLLLGDGVRLFDHLGSGQLELEATRVLHSPAVTHLRYRVVR
jgi:dihydrofolate reductase